MQTSRSIGVPVRGPLTALLTTVLLTVFIAGSVPVAHAQGAPLLFSNGAEVLADGLPVASRAAHVDVNTSLLLDKAGQPRTRAQLPEVTLNLFPDVSYTGLVKEVQRTDMYTSWTGSLAEVEAGYFYLVMADGAFMAHVASPQGIYEVSMTHGGSYRAVQIDQSQLPEDVVLRPDYAPADAPPAAPAAASDPAAPADSGSQIDVLVIYTDDARAGAGGTPAIKAQIAMAITQTNSSYANSGITPRLRLVHVHEYSYVETGDYTIDIERLRGTSDGYFDTVHPLRTKYGADVVVLVVENLGACGVGYFMGSVSTAFAPFAFSAVERPDCLTGYYSFAHQIGHMQSADHDVFDSPYPGSPYVYNHGFVHLSTDLSQRWQTVMAIDGACLDAGYSCTRLPAWSNPYESYLGALMGNFAAKNHMVLNNTASTVASFRTKVISGDFNSNFDTSSAGWSVTSGTWALGSSTYWKYYSSPGVENTFSGIARSGTYGDVTYEVRMKRTVCQGCETAIIVRGATSPMEPDPIHHALQWPVGYRFQYHNSGMFRIWRMAIGDVDDRELGSGMNPAIIANSWNKVKVVAVGPSLAYYINDVLVWSGVDGYLSVGKVGIEFYSYDTGGGNKLYVDRARLWTTPTADALPFADALPGELLLRGDGIGLP